MSHAQSLLFPHLTSSAHSTRTPTSTSLLFFSHGDDHCDDPRPGATFSRPAESNTLTKREVAFVGFLLWCILHVLLSRCSIFTIPIFTYQLSVTVQHPLSHDVPIHQESVVSSHPSVPMGIRQIPDTSCSIVFVVSEDA